MTTEGQAAEATQAKTDEGRGRSTIEFPYLDLANAIEIAQTIKVVGGTSADLTQVAVKLSMAGDGGGFRQRVMTAKTFGLIDYARGRADLTGLGIRVVDPQFERAARVDALLTVPLFKALFEKLNGQALPPAAAIERMAEQLGVAPKQKDKARQVFMRSAKQAGFFELSAERLAVPPGLNGAAKGQREKDDRVHGDKGGVGRDAGGSGGGDGGYHPFIRGLLQKLPPPETEWPVEARAKWLTTASNIFDLMYTPGQGGDSKIVWVEVKSL